MGLGHAPVTLQYIRPKELWMSKVSASRNMHTVFALLCFVVVIHWLIFPYPSGLLHWHCGNLTIAPVPAKQPWWIWINTSCALIMNDCVTTTKQSTTEPCAYFLGYTVEYGPKQQTLLTPLDKTRRRAWGIWLPAICRPCFPDLEPYYSRCSGTWGIVGVLPMIYSRGEPPEWLSLLLSTPGGIEWNLSKHTNG